MYRRDGAPLDALSLDCGAGADSQAGRAVTLRAISTSPMVKGPLPSCATLSIWFYATWVWPLDIQGMAMIRTAALQSGGSLSPLTFVCVTLSFFVPTGRADYIHHSELAAGPSTYMNRAMPVFYLTGRNFLRPQSVATLVHAGAPQYPNVPPAYAAGSPDRFFSGVTPMSGIRWLESRRPRSEGPPSGHATH